MTLLERFIEVAQWPDSRKTALWTIVLLAWHLIAMLAAYLYVSHAACQTPRRRAGRAPGESLPALAADTAAPRG